MEQLDQKTQKRIAELAKQQQKIAAEISKLKNQRSSVVRDIVAKMDKYNVSLADVQEYLNNRKRYVNPTTGETWSGKGRKPLWVENALKSGRSLESLAAK